jgi:hypothetical protein
MANITVKKNDGTTDIVFDQLAGSGGEGIPAVWRQDTGNAAGLPTGLRSTFSMATKWNGPKTARQVKLDMSFPYAAQDSTTTLYSSKDRVVYSGIITIPQAIPLTHVNEAIAQGLNLWASALVKAAAQAGYAPT